MTKSARKLIDRVNRVMFSYHVHKNWAAGVNNDKHFPYGMLDKTLFSYFEEILPNRGAYLNWLDDYKQLIFDIENLITEYKEKPSYRIFLTPTEQSVCDQLGHAVSKMYWLRTKTRQWRREENLKLKAAA